MKHWRALRGLNQTELATRLRWDNTKISKIEKGTQELRASEVEEVAEAFGLSVPEFYGAEEKSA